MNEGDDNIRHIRVSMKAAEEDIQTIKDTRVVSTYREEPSTTSSKEALSEPLLRNIDEDAAAAPLDKNGKKKKSIILNVCLFILITEFCERLAYYGLSGSLIAFFVKKLNYDKVLASELNSLFTTLCYITPLAGAYLSDRYLGRYRTILAGSVIYAVGLFLCTLGSVPPDYEADYFLPGLFLFVTIGSGCIKPCVVTLGADQFDPNDPDQVEEKAKFFNYFYWAINLGATVSYGYLTNLALNGQPEGLGISESWGFFASFLVPTISFVIGIFVFVGGSPRYKHAPPSDSVLGEFAQIVWVAGKKTGQGTALLSGIVAMLLGAVVVVVGYFVHNQTAHLCIAIGGMSFILVGIVVVCYFGKHTTWLNTAADLPTTACKVPDAVEVLRLSPYLGLLCIFWGVYGQMANNFFTQGYF